MTREPLDTGVVKIIALLVARGCHLRCSTSSQALKAQWLSDSYLWKYYQACPTSSGACASLGTGTRLELGRAWGRLHIKTQGPYPVRKCNPLLLPPPHPPLSASLDTAWIFSHKKYVWICVYKCQCICDCLCYGRAVGISGRISVVEKADLVLSDLPLDKHVTVFVSLSCCQKEFFVVLSVTVSLLRPYSVLLYGKAGLEVMTQDQFVSPWSPSLSQACIIIIALYDNHTAPLRANASWQLFLCKDQWALAAAGSLSPAPLY